MERDQDDLFKSERIVDILKGLSMLTWSKIGFSREHKGFKIYETSITQDLIWNLIQRSSISKFQLRIFEATSERKNGNDIEFYIETKEGFIFFPVQAKIIYKDLKYPKLNYPSSGESQIISLINYARRRGGVPIYFLYNYLPLEPTYSFIKKYDLSDLSFYGISYVSAHYLKDKYYNEDWKIKGTKKWTIPSFTDLHPQNAFPLHRIFKDEFLNESKEEYLIRIFNDLDLQFQHKIRQYDLIDLENANGWKELGVSGIGRPNIQKEIFTAESSDSNISQSEFIPCFRVLLSNREKKGVKITIQH